MGEVDRIMWTTGEGVVTNLSNLAKATTNYRLNIRSKGGACRV
jgi:hypothetical protein